MARSRCPTTKNMGPYEKSTKPIQPQKPQATTQFSNWKGNNQWGRPNMGCQSDPNAMDTTPDRIRGRIAESEDFLPGRNRYKPQGRNKGGNPKGRMRDKGKPSFVITAERSDTLHEIADSQSTTITPTMQDHHKTDKVMLKKITLM
jgi:hypothetical protein